MRDWLSKLYVQVFIGLVIGVLLGTFAPTFATSLQPLADGFTKLIKMLLAPVIFGTVVVGIAMMGNLKEVGRSGVRALIYFDVVSTLALVIGLVVVNGVKPGAGLNIDPSRINAASIAGYVLQRSGDAPHARQAGASRLRDVGGRPGPNETP
jgi:aerobic C4-dicarboxylate transport protein